MEHPEYLCYFHSERSPSAPAHLNEAIDAIGSYGEKDRSGSVKEWELPE